MKAAIYQGVGSIGIGEVDVPDPGEGYVLLEMMRCGICGSDLHSYYGHWNQSTNASGHEVVGVVVQLGEGVTGVHIGDRVCVECFSHCGTCRPCQLGRYNHCENRRGASGGGHAGYAEYVLAHESALLPLPEGLSFDQAAMVEPLAVSYRAFCRTGADAQDVVLVVGAGTIGLLATAAAAASGARRVIACARYDHQADMARQLGADDVIRVSGQDLKDRAQEISGRSGIDAVIETTGSAQGMSDALAVVRKAGAVVLVGAYFQALPVHLAPIVNGEINVTGSNCYGFSGQRTDFQWSIDLIASGRVPATELITHRYRLDDIRDAFETAADKTSGSIKVMVSP